MKPQFEALFQPLTFNNGATLPNRLVLAPMTHWASHADGTASEAEIDFVASRSKGLGMVITAATTVHPTGRAFDGEPNAIRAEDLPGLRRLAQSIQAKAPKPCCRFITAAFAHCRIWCRPTAWWRPARLR